MEKNLVQQNDFCICFPHFVLIFLATDNGIIFTDAPESTKQSFTLELNISKVNRK